MVIYVGAIRVPAQDRNDLGPGRLEVLGSAGVGRTVGAVQGHPQASEAAAVQTREHVAFVALEMARPFLSH